ncbi:BspA family leucine-rich repeat surface protein [Roseivirga sp. 4D4]|uniref:BspA family leucine-rich repeat surface protein n=1 Tax=Roseivirga sp. 4D4 TaxID=1889784 RepID=UPI000B316A81|nr:BspA family leucine-rich repeat surface protein [Roseivirga sp. 4D4]
MNGVIDAPGDIVFVAYHDNDDGFSFVLLDDCPTGTEIRFTDEGWNGTSFNSLTSEGEVLWINDSGATLPIGTVVNIEDADDNGLGISASSGSASEVESGFTTGVTADQIFAITGTRATPGVFLAFVGNSSLDGSSTNTLTGTGLVLGSTAVDLGSGEGYYNGPDEFNGTITDVAITLNTFANWQLGAFTFPPDVIDGFGGSVFPGGSTNPFVTTWSIPADDLELTLPLAGTNFSIDWGDGVVDTGLTTGDISHTYASAATYTVSIGADITSISMSTSDDGPDLLTIDQWGDVSWNSMNGAFAGTANMTIVATDIPDLSAVSDATSMFEGAISMNQSISNWDVSNITSMRSMFEGASSFNQDISLWNVAAVTTMREMFRNAIAYNQPLDTWNVGSVTDMSMMFRGAVLFNQDLNSWNVSQVNDMSAMFSAASVFDGEIGNWNVSNVTNMSSMFLFATMFNQPIGNWQLDNLTSMSNMFGSASSFNQDIGSWNVSQVTSFLNLFQRASAFNQNIGDWDVSNVTSLSNTFLLASNFNQPLDNWNVSSVTTLRNTFKQAAAFNQPLTSWNVGNVTDMRGTFENSNAFNQDLNSWDVSGVIDLSFAFANATVFNGDVSSWDVGNVTNMDNTFNSAQAFNQNIAGWNVANVTSMANAFRSTIAFDQNLGNWNVGLVTDMSSIFSISGISIENYDNTLIGWASLPTLQLNVPLGAQNVKYCLGESARQSLIDDFNWNITLDERECPIVFTSPDIAFFAENSFGTIIDINANVGNGDDVDVNYSLGTSNDEGLLVINGSNGELVFNSPPDFENPLDVDANNSYKLEVFATSGSETVSQILTVTVTDVFENIAPVFTSTPVLTVNDNELYSYTITTTDDNNDNTTVSAVTLPSWLNLNAITGSNTITIAGTGGADFINGNGTSAAFAFPAGVAVDNAGNIFVADQDNHVIRKITPSGDVSTFCGSGIQGFADGSAGVARFDNPKDLAFDNSGNLLVADLSNNRIRKVAPDGTVTTLAGSGAAGFINGNGTSAVFRFPAGVAVDAANNVFVADQDNHVIRRITPTGDVTTFAGSGTEGFADGSSGVARFDDPKDLAFDNSGNLYVADFQNNRIRKITPDGTVSTLAGSGAAGFVNGNGTSAVFRFPAGVAVDAFGNVCVADQDNHVIRLITPNGDVSTFAGSGIEGFADGDATTAQFDDPKDITFDNAGNLYVADFENNRIRKLVNNGAILQGNPAGQPSGDYPVVLKVSDGNGGETLQSFTVTIIDATSPVVITQNLVVELDENGEAIVDAQSVDNGSSDTNGIQSFSLSQTNFDCDDIGSVEVSLSVTDNNGLSASATANIEVQDNLSPVLTLVGDQVIQLNLNETFTDQGATASDNCSAVLTVGGDTVDTGVIGSYTVTYDAVDPSGNTAVQLTRTVNVVDVADPEITVVDIQIDNDLGVCGATVADYAATATDNSGVVTLDFDITEGSLFPVGTTPVTATATDGSGNTSQVTFNVTVNDVEDPVLILNGSPVIDLNLGDTYVEQGAMASDNCGASVTIGGDAVNTSSVGIYLVTYDAVDPSGNTAVQLTRTVNVVDVADPEITVVDIQIDNDLGVCGATVADYAATATDNSGVVTLDFDITEGSLFPVGTTPVTATATDGSGNTSQVTFNVTVSDVEDPVLILNGSPVIDLNLGDTYVEQGAMASDNCGASVTIGGDAVNTSSVGVYLVTYDAVDPSGNEAAQLTRTVNVINTTPISLTLEANIANAKLGTNITCAGGMDGSIDATVTGGTLPYTYSWSNGADTEDLGQLPAGVYTLTVTDATGQSIAESITLTEPDPISIRVDMFPSRPLGHYGATHTIYKGFGPQAVWLKSRATGGNGWLRSRWSGPGIKFQWRGIAVVAPKETTTYEVSVTDKKGCTSVESFTVYVIDVRCFHSSGKKKKNKWGRKYGHNKWNGKKVHICHNGRTLCVSVRSVWSHLRHGDSLGACESTGIMSAASSEVDNDVIDFVEPNLEIKAYPNPTDGYTSISFSSNVEGPAKVSVFNSTGIPMATLFEGKLEPRRRMKLDYDTHELPSGIYIVRLVTTGGVKTLKLMVKK